MTVTVNRIFDSRVYDLQFEVETEQTDSDVFVGKWFEGFAVGDFIDTFGRPVEVKKADIPFFLDNTRKAIEATRAESSGEIEGLPVDAKDHERGNAAGWLVDVKMSLAGEKLLFKPKWTVIGFELLKAKLMKGFSPTLSVDDMTIMGGTLTNWPATREDSIPVLAPIELSETGLAKKIVDGLLNKLSKTPENQEEISNEGVPMAKKDKVKDEINLEDIDLDSLSDGQLTELTTRLIEKESGGTNGSKPVSLAQLIETRATDLYKTNLALAQKEIKVANFVKDMTEGTDKDPNGIGVKPEDLSELLSGMDDDQLELAMKVIQTIKANGVVNFEEQGNDDKVEGKIELPKETQTALDAGTLKIKDLSLPSMGLGDMDQYNLSKWQKKEGK